MTGKIGIFGRKVCMTQQFDEQITLIDDPYRDDALGFKIDASGTPKKNIRSS